MNLQDKLTLAKYFLAYYILKHKIIKHKKEHKKDIYQAIKTYYVVSRETKNVSLSESKTEKEINF